MANDSAFAEKKIAGILSETSFTSGKLDRVIVGIGLNVNNILPKKLKVGATTLKALLNRRVDRTCLLSQILIDLYMFYEKYMEKGFGYIKKDFDERSILRDTRVELEEGERIYRGIAEGIDETGYLILRTDQGVQKKITAGTVLKYG